MMEKPNVYLVSVLALTSVLTACGGPGGADELVPVSDLSQEPKVLSGTAGGWTGEDAVVRAETYNADGDPVILAKSPVAADGSFSLSLPGAEGVGDALIIVTEQDLSCEERGERGTVAMTPSRLEATMVELNVYPSPLPDGNSEDDLGSFSFENFWEPTEVIKEVLAVYVTEDVTIRGSCTFTYSHDDSGTGKEVEVTDTTTFDLDLVAGWNDVLATSEDDADSWTTTYSTGAIPEGFTWRYYELVCEDEECEED